jgi:ATP-binding cassette, subfamily B, bacterial
MAWFGGGGGGLGGPSAVQSSARAGLPFAGVPEELREKAEAILAEEPEHTHPPVTFSHVHWDRRPFTLRRFLAPHRWALIGVFVLVAIEALALQAGPLLTQKGIDDGIAKGSLHTLLVIASIYVVAVIISMVTGSARIAWSGRVGEKLLYELRVRVFSHLQRLSLDYFTGEKAGRVMTRMTSDIEALQQLFQDGLVNLAVQGLTMVFVTIILFTLQPSLALITVLAIVPGMTALTWWFRSASDRGYAVVRERIADVLAHLAESLSGIRIITAFNRRRYDITAHRAVVAKYRDANVNTSEITAVYGPATDLIGNLGQVLVLAIGGHQVLEGQLSIGELTAFVLYLTAFFAPVQQLVQLYSTYQSGQAAVTKLRDLLGTEPTVPEAPDAEPLPPIEGHIELRDVTFAYGDEPVLRGVSLVVEPGQTLALVGPTGSGKSTIAKLVVRFYDPASGQVLVDGYDLKRVTFHSLRSQLGVVPQEPFLFAGTVRDNLSFARPDATDDELLAACHAVGLDELLARLPGGLDGVVHERGVSLSSGERQLLALARAFVAQPRVLVLDEATSNLDLKSEVQVERALDAVLEGRTALIIAHRLATAMRADRIGVVRAGRLVELGSHDELVARGGLYAAMYDAWMQHATTSAES